MFQYMIFLFSLFSVPFLKSCTTYKKVSFATTAAMVSCVMTFNLWILSSGEESCGILHQMSPFVFFDFSYLFHTLLQGNIDEETLNLVIWVWKGACPSVFVFPCSPSKLTYLTRWLWKDSDEVWNWANWKKLSQVEKNKLHEILVSRTGEKIFGIVKKAIEKLRRGI